MLVQCKFLSGAFIVSCFIINLGRLKSKNARLAESLGA